MVRAPGGVFLIDCGIGPRTTAQRLEGTGVSRDDIKAICLTHLDRDHVSDTWTATILARQIRVFCPADRVPELVAASGDARIRSLVTGFKSQPIEPVPGVVGHAMRMAHDRTGSHAFHFSSANGSLGYATDLGHVPDALIEHFCGVDLLAIESNYDPEMQRMSGRPLFLQKRIMGGGGHLSNQQSLKAVKEIFDRCHRRGRCLPGKVVLLHRSRQCNCPNLMRSLFASDPRIGPRLILSEQLERTEWIGTGRKERGFGEQLMLAFG